jgi:hypothetical protein
MKPISDDAENAGVIFKHFLVSCDYSFTQTWGGGPGGGQLRTRKTKDFSQRHPTKGKDPPSYVLFESPFASVSTVGRGHPSLVSLVDT